MLQDRQRISYFAEAIRSRIRKNASVLDLGCGVGILASIAAQSGAIKVVAIDRSSIASVAKRVLAGYKDIISEENVIQGDSRNIYLAKEFDLIVSEWIGVHVFQENMLPSILDARDRFLKPGGVMIPENVGVWMAPLIYNPIRETEIEQWAVPIEGVGLNEIRELSCNDLYVGNVLPGQMLGVGKEVYTIDVYSFQEQRIYNMRANFHSKLSNKVEGICGWFVANLTPELVLNTSPFHPLTHWQQTIYSFNKPILVNKGEDIAIEIEIEPHNGYCDFSWRGYVRGRKYETIVEQSTKNNYTIPRKHQNEYPKTYPTPFPIYSKVNPLHKAKLSGST